jgi:hypothetical protein
MLCALFFAVFFNFLIFFGVLRGMGIGVSGLGRADYLALQVVLST